MSDEYVDAGHSAKQEARPPALDRLLEDAGRGLFDVVVVHPGHFHSHPFGNWRGAEKRVRRIVAALGLYGMESDFHAVPIGKQQREIATHALPAFRVLLYRRLMVRVAETLTCRQGGQALVTGESLGQVASQTVKGLAATEAAATLPILRPLIGLD